MEQKIRIGAVSYLNAKPMITGIEFMEEIELILDYPANIAKMLIDDKIDIGLVPVAVIPTMKEHYIISDYGIACDGAVTSVCVFSEVPIEDITTIILDYQSRTSVALLKILLKEYWQIEVQFVEGTVGFENKIEKSTAALVIGDRAFDLQKKFSYCFDLGEIWKIHTGLPFVFATWVSNKSISEDFKLVFSAHLKNKISNYFESSIFQELDKEKQLYLKKTICYTISEKYKEGLNLFLKKLKY